jgi:hypothetical protein
VNSETVTAQVLPLTDRTQLLDIVVQLIDIQLPLLKSEAVINQALLDKSQVSVGTVIFAVTFEVALAQKVLTVVQFF